MIIDSKDPQVCDYWFNFWRLSSRLLLDYRGHEVEAIQIYVYGVWGLIIYESIYAAFYAKPYVQID